MKKNKTEFLSPQTNKKSKNFFKNKTSINLSEYKVNQEIKSLPKDIGDNLKKVLSKNEKTPEVYIPKSIPLNKQYYDRDLLINKLIDCEKFIHEKKKVNTQLSHDNSSFSKIYNYIKEIESENGKISRQQKYFDDVEKIYSYKDYNLNNLHIKKGDNMFNYSMLNNREFGKDVKKDAIKFLNELGKNKELQIELNFIFNLTTLLFNRNLKSKFNEKNDYMKKKGRKQYGFEFVKKIARRSTSQVFGSKNRESLRSLQSFNNLNEKRRFSLNKNEDNEQGFLNKKLQEEISQLKSSIENIKKYSQDDRIPINYQKFINQKIKSSNSSNNSFVNKKDKQKKEILINIYDKKIKENHENQKEILTNIYDKKGKDNHVHFNTENNSSSKGLVEIKNKINEKESNKMTIESYLSSIKAKSIKNLKKIENNNEKNNRNKISFELPKINNSYDESKNIILTDVKDDNNKKIKSILINKKKVDENKTNTSKEEDSTKKLNPDDILHYKKNSEEPIKLTNLKRLKSKKIDYKSIPFLKSFLSGDGKKKILSDNELNKYLLKFKKKNNSFYKNYQKIKIKESNLHGLLSNFQRVTRRYNFHNLFEKNKYLKYYDFNEDFPNQTEDDDENKVMNIKDMDKKISNLQYDLAYFLLNDLSK